MNALDDNCKCVIVLVEGESLYHDACAETSGYHAVCALPEPFCTCEALHQKVKVFCADNNISHTFCSCDDDALLLLRHDAAAEGAPAVEKLKAPLTIITAPAGDALGGLVQALLVPSSTKKSYCLVALLDLTRKRDDEREKQGDSSSSSFAWLVPEPSYLSELAEFYPTGNDVRCQTAPLHMYCCYPLVRDCGMQCSVETFLSTSSNKCTFDSILRELAFKAGQVPKYGN